MPLAKGWGPQLYIAWGRGEARAEAASGARGQGLAVE